MCFDLEYEILWIDLLIYTGALLKDKAVTILMLQFDVSEILR